MNELLQWLSAHGFPRFAALPWLVTMGVILLATVILALLALHGLWAERREARTLRANGELPEQAKRSTVGYKRAFLVDPHAGLPFEGVGGHTRYGADEGQRSDVGFHSFYSLKDAKKHHQKGNLFLEVYSSGEVHHHSQGMEASHQRVLQVLVGKCQDCRREQAELWLDNPKAEKKRHRFRLLCLGCSEVYSQPRTLEELQTVLRESTGVELVVATLKATGRGGRFVPTELEGAVP